MQKNFALFIDTQKKLSDCPIEGYDRTNKLIHEHILKILFLYLYDLEKLDVQ